MTEIFPYVLFRIGGIPVRNSVVATWAVVTVLMALVGLGRRFRPQVLDMLVDFIVEQLAVMVGGDARPFLPLLGSLLVFLLVANTISIVPGFYAPARDINTTIALGVIVYCAVHYYGIRAKGGARYLREYAQPAFLLPLQIIGDISRIVSLTVRLFGNVFAGELLVLMISYLVALIAPLPLMLLSILTGALQAYIFTVLSAVYIRSALPPAESLPQR